MKLLTRPIVSGRRLDRTQTPFSHMHSHVLVEQSGARERACAVSTSKRSFVNVCFHVCAVLHWMWEWLATVRASQVLSAGYSITMMYLKLFAVCKRFKALVAPPSKIINWIKARRCSCLLFVPVASSSVRGRSSIFCQHHMVLFRFTCFSRLSPPQRRSAPLSWRMFCKISPSRWVNRLVFIGSCAWSFLSHKITRGVYTCWKTAKFPCCAVCIPRFRYLRLAQSVTYACLL